MHPCAAAIGTGSGNLTESSVDLDTFVDGGALETVERMSLRRGPITVNVGPLGQWVYRVAVQTLVSKSPPSRQTFIKQSHISYLRWPIDGYLSNSDLIHS